MLEELRRKPKAVRNRYAFVAAVLFTVAIAGIWFLSFGVDLPNETNERQATESEYGRVWSTFTEKVGGVFSQFGNIMSTSTATSSADTTATTTATTTPSAVDRVIRNNFENVENRRRGERQVQIGTSTRATSTTETE